MKKTDVKAEAKADGPNHRSSSHHSRIRREGETFHKLYVRLLSVLKGHSYRP